MKMISEKAGLIVITLAVVGFFAATSLAGMGSGPGSGSGIGGDSHAGKGSMGWKNSGKEAMGRSGMDIGSMPEISTGGLGSDDMTMKVQPHKYRNGRLEFKYFANTHSVSLGNYDLMELSTLEVEEEVYKPIKADRMSGHHAGGKIVFEVPQEPVSFRIVIRNIPKVEERTYEWN